MQISIPDLYVKKEERTNIINTLMEKGYIKDYPVDMRRKDGGVINTLTTSNLRYDANGNAVGLMGTIKDITDRIEKEKKLNDTVELLIKTRDQLIQKDKMAALGRMASGIAHEIRNPLEIIYMGLDYLENNLPDDNPNIHESIEKIFNAVNRADNIIKNVLSFSRQSVYKITQLPLCPFLDNVLILAEQMIQKNGVSVQRKYDNKLLEVAGDYNMLQQVFVNLVSNAVDAMKDRKEKILTVRAYKQFVTEVGYKTGYRRADFFSIGDEMIVVEISDTGKGIPEEALLKIFEPFFTTKPINEGTGLGLSIAHMIMDRLSGTIDVESRENQGTTFYIKLQPTTKITDTKEV
jgi:signal transduction histidine kinase